MFDDILKDMLKKSEEFDNEARRNGKEIEELLKHSITNAKEEKGMDLSVPEKPKTVSEPEEEMTLEEAKKQLDSLIGLEEIKSSIKNLIKRLEGQKVLQEKSKIKIGKPNLHMIYSGPPGTGKTEVARIIGKILHLLGYIKSNKVVETDRAGLVGDYAGATAQKVTKKVQEAMNGVLFIDEAYALANNDGYGKEAIDTLIKALEDHRDDFVVILAGYEAEMDKLISENPGFKSRIPQRFHFKDYTPKELTKIAKKMLEDKGYDTSLVMETIENIIKLQCKNGTLEGNARTVRNFCERIIQNHMIRIGEEHPEVLETIALDDVKKASIFHQENISRAGMDIIQKEAIAKLENLVGLENIKKEVERLLNFFAIQQKKREKGRAASIPEMNMVFTGDAGTGKTEVARIIGEILKGNGVLKNGHLKEVSRADLVGNVVGDTAQKVKRVVAESIGGILFVDRAYSLHSNDSYSAEALDTLIKEIDDNKGQFVVIFAGYGEQMAEMLDDVEGLRTRFRYHFNFDNYTSHEVYEMVKDKIETFQFNIDDETMNYLYEQMLELDFSETNGHWVTEFIERLQVIQSDRLMREDSLDFETITKEDVEETLKDMN